MLKKRIITALWGIPLVVAAVWFDKPVHWFTILAAIAGILAIIEFYRLTGVSKALPLAVCGAALTVLFIIAPQLNIDLEIPFTSLLLATAVILPLIIMVFLPKQEGLYRLWAWTLAGILYIGWLISFLVASRLTPEVPGFPDTGRNLVFFTLFVTFGSDTLAYFIGRAIGRHKMAPSISPGKSWEGAVAGVIGSVIVSLLFIFDTPFQLPLDSIFIIVLAILVSVFGQLGDLAESMLKRGTGVKDSGGLMPGHGGIMDRLDSILFAGAVVYIFFNLVR